MLTPSDEPPARPDSWRCPALPEPGVADLLAEARSISRGLLMAAPEDPKLLHQFGLLAAREGQDAVAAACFRRAIHLASDDEGNVDNQWFSDLAQVLARSGQGDAAISARLHVLRRTPIDAEAYNLLGESLHKEGRHAEAVVVYRESLRLRPGDASTIGALGDALHAAGRSNEALEQYEFPLRLHSDRAGVYLRIGRLRASRSEWSLALNAFREGLGSPDGRESERAALYLGLGQVQVRLGALDAAVTAFREVLCIEPLNLQALRQLVCSLELLGRTAGAERAWLNLGAALDAYDLVDEAITAYRQAIVREPRCLDALVRLGSAHMATGDPVSAVRSLESSVSVAPTHVEAHVKLGRALFQIGDTERGWRELAWSCLPELVKTWRSHEQPLWDGSSLEGRTVLLWAMPDYGLGDTIQLVRFAAFLKARGAHRVVIECQPPLASFVARVPGVDRVVGHLAALPPFDVHAPLTSVPILDAQARKSVGTAVPYLFADEEMTQFWRQRLGPHGGLTVGLCWGTQSARHDARTRSISLAALASLAQVPDVHLVSLQLGPHADEAIVPPSGMRIEMVLAESSTIEHTAALMASLDLVITIDSMNAHLAGALGRPVWTLLPCDADWKWHNGATADTTPWYPTMTLFRQERRGVWNDVVERVCVALQTRAEKGSVPEPLPT